jgi:mannose-6-phosphate isomerase-like protein (cupin superfamily)
MNRHKPRRIEVAGVASLLLFAAALGAAQSHNGSAPVPDRVSQAISVRYEDLKWQVMVPELGNDSPQISILRVDPKTRATQLLIRRPKKMHVPMHWHSANETHTVIQGTAVFEHEGKREELGPGGFNYIPAKMQHQAWTSEGSVVFITVDGAWDTHWVSGPPTKADLDQTPPPTTK